jgi:hypothetical protein
MCSEVIFLARTSFEVRHLFTIHLVTKKLERCPSACCIHNNTRGSKFVDTASIVDNISATMVDMFAFSSSILNGVLQYALSLMQTNWRVGWGWCQIQQTCGHYEYMFLYTKCHAVQCLHGFLFRKTPCIWR